MTQGAPPLPRLVPYPILIGTGPHCKPVEREREREREGGERDDDDDGRERGGGCTCTCALIRVTLGGHQLE